MVVYGLAPSEVIADSSAPKSISDIVALMAQERWDPKRRAEVEALIEAEPPTRATPQDIFEFYRRKASAYSTVGRVSDSAKLLEEAMSFARANGKIDATLAIPQLSAEWRRLGRYQETIDLERAHESFFKKGRGPGRLIASYRRLLTSYVETGQIELAQDVMEKITRAASGLRPRSTDPQIFADVETARGQLLESRGKYAEAESAFMKARRHLEARKADLNSRSPVAETTAMSNADAALFRAAMNMAYQGKLKAAEASARVALINQMQYSGKFGGTTLSATETLGRILMLQGRYADAERMFRQVVEIREQLGYPKDNRIMLSAKRDTAAALALAERWEDAAREYNEIAGTLQDGSGTVSDLVNLYLHTPERAQVLLQTGRVNEGMEVARSVLIRTEKLKGAQHPDTAFARGQLAVGYALARQFDQALPLFQSSVPILVTARQISAAQRTRSVQDDLWGGVQETSQFSQVIEAYITTLANFTSTPDLDPAVESLKLVDLIRAQTVQRALSASSARASSRDLQLESLMRQEQEVDRQIGAMQQGLTDRLALPQDKRDAGLIKQMENNLAKARKERIAIQRTISRRFPTYVDLVNPHPPSADEIRETLTPDEVFVSFYVARQNSFIWVVPKTGPIGFAVAALSAAELEQKVGRLRESLEPKAEFIEGIRAFDLATAYELYAHLLKPLESLWRPSKSLVVVTNGALGLLPLGVLPTEPITVRANPSAPVFSEYRDVPWLARSHAVATVPSAAAFTGLRNLRSSTKKREPMIGFGDPLFSREQAVEAELTNGANAIQMASAIARSAPLNRRNTPKTAGVDGAQLAMLPRLPDTSDELKAIALTLQSDPGKVLHLGKEANTRKVKTVDLSIYKVVAFATHGLVPGELDGLYQPALALSAPEVAGVDGDGLLTMEDILGLKLDADWVVLSACNTGAGTGSGAGAEAASGLGRAFFYAGSRAILVTNWSVHSASARDLVTDIFRRQAENDALSRSEALRASSMAMLDGAGFQIGGKTIFTYAHPIFWAPYSIIGDGGGGAQPSAPIEKKSDLNSRSERRN